MSLYVKDIEEELKWNLTKNFLNSHYHLYTTAPSAEPKTYHYEGFDFDRVEHFEPSDFADPDYAGSEKYMNPWTIMLLNEIVETTGEKIQTHVSPSVRGAVCVKPEGHSDGSKHYITYKDGCSAVDWHFKNYTDSPPPRELIMEVVKRFTGIGFYFKAWKWGGEPLYQAFHTDLRIRPQFWAQKYKKTNITKYFFQDFIGSW